MNEGFDRVGRPTQPVNRDINGAPVAPQAASGIKKPKLRINGFKAVFVLLLGSVAVLIIAVLLYMVAFKGSDKTVTSQIKTSQYQAIFLNSADGQVYFGKLVDYNSSYYQLTDIYYVRVNQAVQPDKTQAATPNISLAKLGSEIHGPEDTMFITKNSVMFWENLKEDGQVVCAVRDYQITTLKISGVKKSDKCNAAPASSSNSNTTTPTPTASPTIKKTP